MKKLLTILSIFLLSVSITEAQKTKYGVKGGMNISNLRGDIDDMWNTKTKVGAYFGGYARIHLVNKLSIQPEVLLSMQGGRTRYGIYTARMKANYKLVYINIPATFQYMVYPGLRLEFGPQLGFNISDDIDVMYGYTKSAEANAIDFSLNFGVNYEIPGGFNVGGRFSLGLLDVNDDNNNNYDIKNTVFSFGAGYTF